MEAIKERYVYAQEGYVYTDPDYSGFRVHDECDRVIKICSDVKKEFNEYMFSILGSYSDDELPILYRTIMADKIKEKIQEKLGYDVGDITDIFNENKDDDHYVVFKYRSKSEKGEFEVYLNKDNVIKYIKEIHIFDQDISLD